jgi:hypothetical protein
MSLEKDGSLPSTLDILKISSSKALSGGIPGALAMVTFFHNPYVIVLIQKKVAFK